MRKELQAELPCHRYSLPTLSIEKENKAMTDYPNNIPVKLEIIKASEITPKEAHWLWYLYIPFGKVTLLQGEGHKPTSIAPTALSTLPVRREAFLPSHARQHALKISIRFAIAPILLSSFAGEQSQNIGRSFLKSYAAVCLEGAIVVLACIIFSLFA